MTSIPHTKPTSADSPNIDSPFSHPSPDASNISNVNPVAPSIDYDLLAEKLAEKSRTQSQNQIIDDTLPITFDRKTESAIVKNLFSTVVKKTTDQILQPQESPIKSVVTQITELKELMTLLRGGSDSGIVAKTNWYDKIINSQLALGLGSNPALGDVIRGLGDVIGHQRASEIANVVQKKMEQDGISQGPGAGPNAGIAGSRPTPSSPGQGSPDLASHPKQQSEKDLLLSLSPDNPEHVAAYAETQGGLPVDVARKMLMIHQDAFIKQMEKDIEKVGQPQQHVDNSKMLSVNQSPQAIPQNPNYQNPVYHVSQEQIPQSPPSYIQQIPQQQIPQTPPFVESPSVQYQNNIQSDQLEKLSNDIGKMMNGVLDRVDQLTTRTEQLNNTIFTLQTELNEVKEVNQLKLINVKKEKRKIESFNNVDNIVDKSDNAINAENIVKKDDVVNEDIEVNTGDKWPDEPFIYTPPDMSKAASKQKIIKGDTIIDIMIPKPEIIIPIQEPIKKIEQSEPNIVTIENIVSTDNNNVSPQEVPVKEMPDVSLQEIKDELPKDKSQDELTQNVLVLQEQQPIQKEEDIKLVENQPNIQLVDVKDMSRGKESSYIKVPILQEQQPIQKEEDIKLVENQPNIQISTVKDTKWWKNKKDDIENMNTSKKYEKGSMGWLKEQKRLKEQKLNKDKINS